MPINPSTLLLELTKLHKSIVTGGFLLILIFPLIVGEYDRLLYPMGHDLFIWLGIEVIALSFLVLAMIKRKTSMLPRFSWIIVLFILWWIATGFATLFSPQTYLSFWEIGRAHV